MSISRRHFEAIAKAVQKNHRDDLKVVEPLVRDLADTLATTSGSFNKPLFLQACGFKSKSGGAS